MITTNDIAALISFAILNNKQGVIQAMNSTGNTVPAGISDAKLAEEVWNVFDNKGVQALQQVLSKVPVDRTKVTEEEAKAFVTKFKGVDPAAKFGDWITGVGNYFGDLLGGSSVSTGTVTQMFSESAISPALIGLITVIGLILIILFRKFIAVVVGVIVIVLAVVLYGIFAKKITTTSTGGGTTSHGGVGQVVLGWLSGIF